MKTQLPQAPTMNDRFQAQFDPKNPRHEAWWAKVFATGMSSLFGEALVKSEDETPKGIAKNWRMAASR